MSRRLERPLRDLFLSLCVFALGIVPWTGCDKPGAASESAPEKSSKTTSESKSSHSASSGESTGNAEGPSSTTQSGDKKISRAELEKFARVAELLGPKSDALMNEVEQAETESEKERVQKRLKRAARRAAEKAGLPYERFRVISQRMKNDPSLKRRIRKLMADRASPKQ